MNEMLPILTLETSGDLCSVCIYSADDNFSEANVQRKQIHSELILSLVDQCIANMNLQKHELKSIAVSMGPGSFTGLRIGMSVAKGIAFGLGLPLVPIPTFEVSAHALFMNDPRLLKVAIVNKVNKDEVYLQNFSRTSGRIVTSKIEVVSVSKIDKIDKSFSLFGNYSHLRITRYGSPKGLTLAKWAYIFGQDLLTYQYDYLEPNYIKNFIAKVKK